MIKLFRSLHKTKMLQFVRKNKKIVDISKMKPIYEYDPVLAIKLMKSTSYRHFPESVDICIKLGINPKRTDHNIRGTCVLPSGVGRTQRICFFGGNAEEEALALSAGADLIGNDVVIENIKNDIYDFDSLYSSTTGIGKLKSLARILGPKGMFPNVKVKTLVAPDEIGKLKSICIGRREKRKS